MKLAIGTMRVVLALAAPSVGRPQQRSQPVVVKVESGGFHVIDALIGAGALAGLTLGATGVLNLFHRGGRPVGSATTKEEGWLALPVRLPSASH